MEMWTTIATLVADPECADFRRFGDNGKGACVNIVAWADSEKDFEQRVEKVCRELDCIVLEFENIQLLEARMEEADFPEELLTMRATAIRQPADTIFGTFHIWTDDHII